jgi:hypothetical protein
MLQVRRIIAQFDAQGDVAPVKYEHGPKQMLGQHDQDTIIELLMANPAIYLDDLQQELHLSTGTGPALPQFFVPSIV